MDKATVNVSIFDETYSLVTDESEETLKQAAAIVDEKMREISRAGFRNEQRIAVLVALQLASKLLVQSSCSEKCQQDYTEVIGWLEKQNKVLSDLF